jgi:hypothetical protein
MNIGRLLTVNNGGRGTVSVVPKSDAETLAAHSKQANGNTNLTHGSPEKTPLPMLSPKNPRRSKRLTHGSPRKTPLPMQSPENPRRSKKLLQPPPGGTPEPLPLPPEKRRRARALTEDLEVIPGI